MNATTEQSTPQPDTEGYKAFMRDVRETEGSNTEAYDRALLTLSTALLGLSITFLKDVVPLETAIELWLLFTAWGLLAGTVLTTITGYIFSSFATAWLKRHAHEFYTTQNPKLGTTSHALARIHRGLNVTGGVMFMLGVVAITVFSIVNIKEQVRVSRQTDDIVTRSLPTPTFSEHQTVTPSGQQPTQTPAQPAQQPAQQPAENSSTGE